MPCESIVTSVATETKQIKQNKKKGDVQFQTQTNDPNRDVASQNTNVAYLNNPMSPSVNAARTSGIKPAPPATSTNATRMRLPNQMGDV